MSGRNTSSRIPDRFSLGKVSIDENGEPHIVTGYDDTELTFNAYSRFKYGDGAVSRVYGAAIARHLMPLYLDTGETGDVYVTSSAYKIARPASSSLVEPFVGVAQSIVRSAGLKHRVIPFKINRANLTDGDYASMSVEERDEIMRRNGLSLPEGVDISDKKVIAIDDIRVTGSHEISLDNALRKNGAAAITHAYILDVIEGKSNPTLEAKINGTSINTIDDLIEMASLKHFAANARFGKRILTETPENIQKFCDSLSLRITSRLIYDALGDGLDTMPRYAEGLQALEDAYADRLTPGWLSLETK